MSEVWSEQVKSEEEHSTAGSGIWVDLKSLRLHSIRLADSKFNDIANGTSNYIFEPYKNIDDFQVGDTVRLYPAGDEGKGTVLERRIGCVVLDGAGRCALQLEVG